MSFPQDREITPFDRARFILYGVRCGGGTEALPSSRYYLDGQPLLPHRFREEDMFSSRARASQAFLLEDQGCDEQLVLAGTLLVATSLEDWVLPAPATFVEDLSLIESAARVIRNIKGRMSEEPESQSIEATEQDFYLRLPALLDDSNDKSDQLLQVRAKEQHRDGKFERTQALVVLSDHVLARTGVRHWDHLAAIITGLGRETTAAALERMCGTRKSYFPRAVGQAS
jgi:hypothetical protein